ncbi:MAG: peroxidase-related enzyme, partial [Alphaproteobacteria bacterium]|nr:peroxidase-related enzyme [Alphaproteobacteria bacterium]
MNYRNAKLEPRQRAMLDFSVKMTEDPKNMNEADRQSLRDVGFSDADIFDIADTAAFFNMTNRVALAIDMMPNLQYHGQNR